MRFHNRLRLLLAAVLVVSVPAQAWDPVAVKDDPLVRMPGTQPEAGVALESPNRCLNCHAGYNQAVEPGFNWAGSMMAQAARDPLFWATLAVAAQDSVWATGTPNATDICLRCHLPMGWLGGRSDPTNATAMTGDDFDGVQCDFCHRSYDPFFVDSHSGTREPGDRLGYWDETNASGTPSQPAADSTVQADLAEAGGLRQFDGSPTYGPDGRPAEPGYVENGGGQYYVAADAAKRASFADAAARHQMQYSRFHKSRYFCGVCHDVSNPVLANLGWDGVGPLPTEELPAFGYFHVERTFSEFMLSAYGRGSGAAGSGPFAPEVFDTSLPGNVIGKCQDCHMRDVVGAGANKNGSPVRPGGSVEHPQSGQPLHDLTGGNVWVSRLLASAVSGSPAYDATNAALLGQGRAALGMDLVSGQGVNPEAMLAGAERAGQQLALAARIDNLSYDAATGRLAFRVVNQTGHKLISGYPEGRRMWLNVRVLDAGGALLEEINPYDAAAATLKGLGGTYADPYPDGSALPAPAALSGAERHEDALVYEAKMTSALTGEEKTFHFALATGRYKDNRIPPKGFDVSGAAARMALPVDHGADAPGYYSASEYSGGYDEVALDTVPGGSRVEIALYYQTTSREYVQFLSDEIDGRGTTLPGPGAGGDPAYLAQTDPFFSGLAAWGETIWKLWKHNRDLPGAAPVLMASAQVGGAPACTTPVPTLLSAEAGHKQVSLAWSAEHLSDPGVTGYGLYYDQAGKAQLVADLGQATTYTDGNLTDGQQYCYKVTSRKAGCESAYSNVLCATPTSTATPAVIVESLVTGRVTTSGKGKNATTEFTPATGFTAGEAIGFRVRLVDASGNPVSGSAGIAVTGPDGQSLTTGSTDGQGYALATWQTSGPNRKGNGGTTPGSYQAAASGVSASGYQWDGATPTAAFSIR